jgi:hypothetical protein
LLLKGDEINEYRNIKSEVETLLLPSFLRDVLPLVGGLERRKCRIYTPVRGAGALAELFIASMSGKSGF